VCQPPHKCGGLRARIFPNTYNTYPIITSVAIAFLKFSGRSGQTLTTARRSWYSSSTNDKSFDKSFLQCSVSTLSDKELAFSWPGFKIPSPQGGEGSIPSFGIGVFEYGCRAELLLRSEIRPRINRGWRLYFSRKISVLHRAGLNLSLILLALIGLKEYFPQVS
jgi:hypothetical protein